VHEQGNIQIAHHLKRDCAFEPVPEVKVGSVIARVKRTK
jgi:hypothetical protein